MESRLPEQIFNFFPNLFAHLSCRKQLRMNFCSIHTSQISEKLKTCLENYFNLIWIPLKVVEYLHVVKSKWTSNLKIKMGKNFQTKSIIYFLEFENATYSVESHLQKIFNNNLFTIHHTKIRFFCLRFQQKKQSESRAGKK